MTNNLTRQVPLVGPERLLARWVTPKMFDGGGKCPYLRRWELADRGGWAVWIHRWLNSDWAPHLHDHSRAMLSIGLWGGYLEHLPEGRSKRWRAPWIRWFPATHQHRVVLDRGSCWTLVLAWPRSHISALIVNGIRTLGSTYLRSAEGRNHPGC